MDTTVCLIGTGVSCVAVAKTRHQQGIAFDCFERGGGRWR